MKKCGAEFIGTFALVFAGTGAIVINETSGGAITHVGISLTFGLIVLAMIYTVGDISGRWLSMRARRRLLLNSMYRHVFDVFKSGQFFPYVITVCDESEAAGCPIFPGVTYRLHWSFPDPSAIVGTQQEQLEGTRKIRDDIRAQIETWCDEMCAVDA
jgi:hypothetical protein